MSRIEICIRKQLNNKYTREIQNKYESQIHILQCMLTIINPRERQTCSYLKKKKNIIVKTIHLSLRSLRI